MQQVSSMVVSPIPQVDRILEPYAKKSYEMHRKYTVALLMNATVTMMKKRAHKKSHGGVQREMEQGFQGWEHKFKYGCKQQGRLSVYYGNYRTCNIRIGKMASKTMLNVRKKGEGKKTIKTGAVS